MGAGRASELRKFLHFHILKLISFHILLEPYKFQILCRYKWHACRLTCYCTCTDKTPKKSIVGRGKCCPGYASEAVLFHNFYHSPPLFSSPEPKARVSYCRPFSSVVRRASSVVRRPSSVNFLHFHLLLENAWLDFNQTWQESSLGVGDSKLFK